MRRLVSKAERRYTEGGIAQGMRADGRGRLQFRHFSVEAGVIPQANGSARVRLGGTDVIASVKAELGTPVAGKPNHGSMLIAVECSGTAAPEYEGREGEEVAMELSRALQRCLLGGGSGAGGAIDLSKLGLVEGKMCWIVYVDGLVLCADGNVLDCLSIAVKAALNDTGLPKVEVSGGGSADVPLEVDVDDDPQGFAKLDAARVPLIVTLTKVGRHYLVDASSEEESQMSAAVSVAVNPQGLITGVTKRTGVALRPSVLLDMLSVAQQVSDKLIWQMERTY